MCKTRHDQNDKGEEMSIFEYIGFWTLRILLLPAFVLASWNGIVAMSALYLGRYWLGIISGIESMCFSYVVIASVYSWKVKNNLKG